MREYLERVMMDIGDCDAWEQIMKKCKGKVKHLLLVYNFRYSDWDDVEQEIWIKVVKGIHRYNIEESFMPWFYVVADNVCKDYLVRNSRSYRVRDEKGKPAGFVNIVEKVFEGDIDEGDQMHFSIDSFEGSELRMLLYKAFDTINNKDHLLAFLLCEHRGLTLKEAARALKKPESAIHNWPSRVKKELRKVLSVYFEDYVKI